MKKFLLILSFLLLIKSLHSQIQTETPAPAIDKEQTIAWLNQNSIPIKTVRAGNDFNDIVPIKKVLQDVRIVGLGEATHGTREFFQMKHRMIEFLIKELDFNILAMEFNYCGAENINNYILNGEGDVYSALKSQGLLVWNTEETIEMLKWLRKYNQTVSTEKKVIIKGLDIRCNFVGDNFTIIKNYLSKVDPKNAEQNDSLLKIIQKLDSELNQGINTDSAKTEYLKLLSSLSTRRGDFIQHSSSEEYKSILQRMTVIGQNLSMNYFKNDDPRELYYEKTRLRDYYMASNLLDLIQQNPNKKIIVWGHNGHISKAGPQETENIKMLGNYLKEAFGPSYYSIGFSFDKGKFQSFEYSDERKPLGMQEFTVKDDHPNTIDWYMSQASINPFFVNFRITKTPDFLQNFLEARLLTRSIGGQAIRSRVELMNVFCTLEDSYDGLIFINNTTRATPIK